MQFPQDQASSPGEFTTLCLEKKGAAGIDKFKSHPPSPPASLPHGLPSPLITLRVSTANSTWSPAGVAGASVSHLLLSLSCSFHTNQGTGREGALSPGRAGTLPEVKVPFSNRPQRQPGLECCRPPPRLLWALSPLLPKAEFPEDLVLPLTFLLLVPRPPQPHLTLPSPSSSP